jgi:adenosylcobinamide kinase/adenosylcobinamide-phosphate guanylyltransferase
VTVTLVTGPVRSGKSRHAEHLLINHAVVRYVATGSTRDADEQWQRRVEQHRLRRPAGWVTVESLEVAAELRTAEVAVLVDCLGTWLTGLVDRVGWEDLDAAAAQVAAARDDLLAALEETRVPVVVVTNEVGWSLVPTTASGRFFQDELGRLNAAVARRAARVHLVIAGRVLDLTSAPAVPETLPPGTLRA